MLNFGVFDVDPLMWHVIHDQNTLFRQCHPLWGLLERGERDGDQHHPRSRGHHLSHLCLSPRGFLKVGILFEIYKQTSISYLCLLEVIVRYLYNRKEKLIGSCFVSLLNWNIDRYVDFSHSKIILLSGLPHIWSFQSFHLMTRNKRRSQVVVILFLPNIAHFYLSYALCQYWSLAYYVKRVSKCWTCVKI